MRRKKNTGNITAKCTKEYSQPLHNPLSVNRCNFSIISWTFVYHHHQHIVDIDIATVVISISFPPFLTSGARHCHRYTFFGHCAFFPKWNCCMFSIIISMHCFQSFLFLFVNFAILRHSTIYALCVHSFYRFPYLHPSLTGLNII